MAGLFGKHTLVKDRMDAFSVHIPLWFCIFYLLFVGILTIVLGKVEKKLEMKLPSTVTNVIKCKNPRCITSVEQELPHIFKKTDNGEKAVYRCIYCETKAE